MVAAVSRSNIRAELSAQVRSHFWRALPLPRRLSRLVLPANGPARDERIERRRRLMSPWSRSLTRPMPQPRSGGGARSTTQVSARTDLYLDGAALPGVGSKPGTRFRLTAGATAFGCGPNTQVEPRCTLRIPRDQREQRRLPRGLESRARLTVRSRRKGTKLGRSPTAETVSWFSLVPRVWGLVAA